MSAIGAAIICPVYPTHHRTNSSTYFGTIYATFEATHFFAFATTQGRPKFTTVSCAVK